MSNETVTKKKEFVPPAKVTTDFFDMASILHAEGGLNFHTVFSDRKVAVRGPNGYYAVKTGTASITPEGLGVGGRNPLSIWSKLRDHFSGYADFTKPLPEAMQELEAFQAKNAHRDRTFSTPKDAVHISNIRAEADAQPLMA